MTIAQTIMAYRDGIDGPPWLVALFIAAWLVIAVVVTRRLLKKRAGRGRR